MEKIKKADAKRPGGWEAALSFPGISSWPGRCKKITLPERILGRKIPI
jgi:hypothetical protein